MVPSPVLLGPMGGADRDANQNVLAIDGRLPEVGQVGVAPRRVRAERLSKEAQKLAIRKALEAELSTRWTWGRGLTRAQRLAHFLVGSIFMVALYDNPPNQQDQHVLVSQWGPFVVKPLPKGPADVSTLWVRLRVVMGHDPHSPLHASCPGDPYRKHVTRVWPETLTKIAVAEL